MDFQLLFLCISCEEDEEDAVTMAVQTLSQHWLHIEPLHNIKAWPFSYIKLDTR